MENRLYSLQDKGNTEERILVVNMISKKLEKVIYPYLYDLYLGILSLGRSL
jgi:hypothetical protein